MKTYTFIGGIHPDDMKALSKDQPIEDFPTPDRLVVPLSQHIGAPAKPIVSKGDKVLKGQKIADANGFVSAPIHAPTSGMVISIEPYFHPFGQKVDAITIKPDGEDKAIEGYGEKRDWQKFDSNELKNIISDAGIVGLGGATFPTHVKLSPPQDKKIDTLIINGVECEPYLTSDYRLMLERTGELLYGCEIIKKILNINNCIIGIEANKPDCKEIIDKKIKDLSIEGTKTVLLELKYPQGAEIQLIDAITGREVPSGGLPMDIGVVVQNVGTTISVYDAVALNKPLINRVVTLTGSPVKKRGNYIIPFGTLLKDILNFVDADINNTGKIIFGGPMMGISQAILETPIIKGISGILLQDINETIKNSEYSSCIRCGKCVEVCPMRLLPAKLGLFAEKMKYEMALDFGIFDCKECGCCTYICPANRPLTHWIKIAKFKINEAKRKQKNHGG